MPGYQKRQTRDGQIAHAGASARDVELARAETLISQRFAGAAFFQQQIQQPGASFQDIKDVKSGQVAGLHIFHRLFYFHQLFIF